MISRKGSAFDEIFFHGIMVQICKMKHRLSVVYSSSSHCSFESDIGGCIQAGCKGIKSYWKCASCCSQGSNLNGLIGAGSLVMVRHASVQIAVLLIATVSFNCDDQIDSV